MVYLCPSVCVLVVYVNRVLIGMENEFNGGKMDHHYHSLFSLCIDKMCHTMGKKKKTSN